MKSNPNPQTGPLTALAQLLSEHPELPPLDWSVTASGFLHGAWSGDEDVRPLIDAYAAVLGGEPSDYSYTRSGGRRAGFALKAVWRDISFDVWVSGPARVQGVAA
ncbi:hypothetical protein [Streptomyces antibioticus]|uniref:hypothetical protein n=1 Tax=Streptomyces antibioticus TaxID=1890 RepID=UPI003400ACF6